MNVWKEILKGRIHSTTKKYALFDPLLMSVMLDQKYEFWMCDSKFCEMIENTFQEYLDD